MRIVLVEDNEMLARGVENALRDHGHAVDHLADGREAEEFVASEGADLLIVDVNLPGLNGFDLVRSLRARGDPTPVLMLTARSDTADRVAGLDAGADDYLVKPFEMSELCARIRALSRRRGEFQSEDQQIGDLSYNRGTRRVLGPEGAIDLPRRELALFEYFLANADRVVSKEQIGDALYGVGSDCDPNAVELLVSRLRRKLKGCGITIHTARGLGYLFTGSRDA